LFLVTLLKMFNIVVFIKVCYIIILIKHIYLNKIIIKLFTNIRKSFLIIKILYFYNHMTVSLQKYIPIGYNDKYIYIKKKHVEKFAMRFSI
jgi:hypothetical protein